MNQKLSDWASIAEIISGVAVLVTLIVLILGIRDNTQVLRASAYANNIDSLNDLSAEITKDEDSLRVWGAFLAGETEDLDEVDALRLLNYVFMIFRIYEKAYFFEQNGLIGEEEKYRFDRNTCSQFGNVRSASMAPVLETILTREFFVYITDSCRD